MRGWINVLVICPTLMCHFGAVWERREGGGGGDRAPNESQAPDLTGLLEITQHETRILERQCVYPAQSPSLILQSDFIMQEPKAIFLHDPRPHQA